MQLCQNARIIGRVSRGGGPPSSNETVTRNVGPIRRIARNPAHVISHSKNFCHKPYGRPGLDASPETADVVAVPTPVLYRPNRSSGLTLRQRSANNKFCIIGSPANQFRLCCLPRDVGSYHLSSRAKRGI